MTRSLDDHSLVEACRAGQTEAFGALVERYQERLYQVLLHVSGSPDDARDVLQDTFLRAYEKLNQFQGDSSFYTWVYRIGVNLALSGHRRRRSRPGSAGRTTTEPLETKSRPTTQSIPTPRIRSSGQSASRSSRPPSGSLARNTEPSSC